MGQQTPRRKKVITIMKNKYFLFVILAMFLSCALLLNPVAQAEEASKPAGKQDGNTISERLLKAEKELRAISENQKKIEAKNSEIKIELANLRIWIYRR